MSTGRHTRKEWDLITVPYWREHFPNDLLLGEMTVMTGGDSKTKRQIDGIIIRRQGRGGAPPEPMHWSDLSLEERRYWKAQLRGANLVVVQSKLQRAGLSLLGQTLVSTFLLRNLFDAPAARGLALATATSDEVEMLSQRQPFRAVFDVRVHPALPPVRPSVEAKPEPDLLPGLLGGLLVGYKPAGRLAITSDEMAEAVYVRDGRSVAYISDLHGRDVVLAHTTFKTAMSALGHAIFSAELVRDIAPSALRTLLCVRVDDPVLTRQVAHLGVEVISP